MNFCYFFNQLVGQKGATFISWYCVSHFHKAFEFRADRLHIYSMITCLLDRDTHLQKQKRRSNLLVVEAWLWSRSGRQPPHQAGPVPWLLRVLAKADSVGLGWAELTVGWQQLVLPLHGGRDHVEEDGRATHRLPENVLGSGGDTERVRERVGRSCRQKWISFNMIRDRSTIMYYHSLTDIEG